MADSKSRPAEKPGVEVYMENLKRGRRTKQQIAEEENAARRRIVPKKVVAGAEFLDSIPHAPWPSRSMLKRRVVLGTPELKVRNGITRIIYPSGAMYEGEVREGKRHGLGVYSWKQGDSYAGMWFMGLMHGLGVAEYASEAAYLGEWYLGDRVGSGMYFYAPTNDEPHKEYAGQWKNDCLHGIGKRLSKNGTVYLGAWRGGVKHGDGVNRVVTETLLDPLGAAKNAYRKVVSKGATGRYSKMDAKAKAEVDTEQIMGGIKDWHGDELGVVVQEGRFMNDEYEPRDKEELKQKRRRQQKEQEAAEEKEKAKKKKKKKKKKGKKGKIGDDEDEEESDEESGEDEEDKNPEKAARRRARQAKLRALARRQGKILASKDFPPDDVEVEMLEPMIQASMEIADAAELVGKKCRARYEKVNFNFRVSKIE